MSEVDILGELTLDVVKHLLMFDPNTGVFTWRVAHGRAQPGQVAGSPDKNGYILISIAKKKYGAHRLAFYYMKGYWPRCQIDHRDLNTANNVWSNLREATQSQNMANRPSRGSVGLKGVFRNHLKYRAQINIGGKIRNLGTYETPEEAHLAYVRAASEVHGEFAQPAMLKKQAA